MKMSTEVLSRLDDLQKSIQENQFEKPFGVKEAATFLHVSISHLYKMTHKRLVPHYKPNGKMLYFYRKDLENFISSKPVKTKIQIENEAISRMQKGGAK